MPPFEIPAYESPQSMNTGSTFNEKSLDVNDSLQSHDLAKMNSWEALHNSYGIKILQDKTKWLSKYKILDV